MKKIMIITVCFMICSSIIANAQTDRYQKFSKAVQICKQANENCENILQDMSAYDKTSLFEEAIIKQDIPSLKFLWDIPIKSKWTEAHTLSENFFSSLNDPLDYYYYTGMLVAGIKTTIEFLKFLQSKEECIITEPKAIMTPYIHLILNKNFETADYFISNFGKNIDMSEEGINAIFFIIEESESFPLEDYKKIISSLEHFIETKNIDIAGYAKDGVSLFDTIFNQCYEKLIQAEVNQEDKQWTSFITGFLHVLLKQGSVPSKESLKKAVYIKTQLDFDTYMRLPSLVDLAELIILYYPDNIDFIELAGDYGKALKARQELYYGDIRNDYLENALENNNNELALEILEIVGYNPKKTFHDYLYETNDFYREYVDNKKEEKRQFRQAFLTGVMMGIKKSVLGGL